MTDVQRRTLAPVPGGRVRKPDGSVLADAGESVVFDTYWLRRLNHGDVVEIADDARSSARKGDDK